MIGRIATRTGKKHPATIRVICTATAGQVSGKITELIRAAELSCRDFGSRIKTAGQSDHEYWELWSRGVAASLLIKLVRKPLMPVPWNAGESARSLPRAI